MKYNEPIEVTKEQYNLLKSKFAGFIAHRKIEDRYYIKVLGKMRQIKQILDEKNNT